MLFVWLSHIHSATHLKEAPPQVPEASQRDPLAEAPAGQEDHEVLALLQHVGHGEHRRDAVAFGQHRRKLLDEHRDVLVLHQGHVQSLQGAEKPRCYAHASLCQYIYTTYQTQYT